jgi:mRNA interferase MazF
MKKWDVVLLSYPFTDLTAVKVRPAIVISPDSENASLDDGLFLLITSNTTRASAYDFVVDAKHAEFPGTGLAGTSAMRTNKLFTLKKTLVRKTLGHVGPLLQKEISTLLRQYLDLP